MTNYLFKQRNEAPLDAAFAKAVKLIKPDGQTSQSIERFWQPLELARFKSNLEHDPATVKKLSGVKINTKKNVKLGIFSLCMLVSQFVCCQD